LPNTSRTLMTRAWNSTGRRQREMEQKTGTKLSETMRAPLLHCIALKAQLIAFQQRQWP